MSEARFAIAPRVRRLVTRTATVAFLTLGLGLTACDKGGGTDVPAGGDGGSAKKGDGIEFMYAKEGFALDAKAHVVFEIAGGQSGLVDFSGSGKLVAAPEGDKLKITTTIAELTNVEIDGVLKRQITAEPDKLKAAAKGQQNWMIIELGGEIDEEATKAIPEVKARIDKAEARRAEEEKKEGDKAEGDKAEGDKAEGDKAEGEAKEGEGEGEGEAEEADLGEFGSQLLSLPSLPRTALKPGKEISLPTEEEEYPLGGESLPVEVDRKYTLTSIDESSGERIATVTFVEEGSGAKEMSGPQGSMFVAIEQESTGTLVFNLDKGIPVSFQADQASALSFGDQTFEQIVEIEYEFTPAG